MKQLPDITHRKRLIIILDTSAMVMTAFSQQQPAYAFHYGGQKWSSAFNHCTEDPVLDTLVIDGSTGQSSKVRDALYCKQ